ncbi:MBL fold metallo-hydrolase [Rubrivivax sp. A210]|uniref:MBL fold metallo-hydrolase n=1 Tax=Rubrivivax sp. A210 TaxID=2772301 RepID=UPI0019B317F2|nr:MBL fold metallo-hydrolase [Rubrivivax sp. A210]CAD5372697.1 MBL fold metallo-hydrolase [Rubrivivax sp. A210]
MPKDAALAGLTVLERGWLSSNNVLLHGHDGEAAVLVDSGHVAHAALTVALVGQALGALGGAALGGVVNTHLHSDHCGGNAALQRAFGCRITIPPGLWQAALDWDTQALGYAPAGHDCERFTPDAKLAPGEHIEIGGRRWQALAAPGHDPHSLILFDAHHGVVISADALWENGFGVVFPELDGEAGFEDVACALDLIGSLDARWAIPGHGAPFGDVAGALQRARRRLDGFVTSPEKHHRHAAKVMIKYRLLEVQRSSWPELLGWLGTASLVQGIWQRLGRPCVSLDGFAEQMVGELAATGALRMDAGQIYNA